LVIVAWLFRLPSPELGDDHAESDTRVRQRAV
jgi:hypothetical protein